MARGRLSNERVRTGLRNLDQKRIAYQQDLYQLSISHPDVCAECKGHCCGGIRERDAFIDRVVQDPETPYLGARRRAHSSLVNSSSFEPEEDRVAVMEDECIAGCCSELTRRGCRIPYEMRPIQCTVYFCRRYVNALSNQEADTGLKAVNGLMKVQLRTVLLMLRS